MSQPLLPPVYLRRATSGEKVLCWKRTNVLWGGPTRNNFAAYHQRETITSIDCDVIYWVLSTHRDPPPPGTEDADTILGSCETLRRGATVNGRSECCYGIASVFTHPGYRGRGVAAIMMEMLGQWLDSPEAGCRVSMLWSDVGKDFYAKRGGWQSCDSRELILNVALTATANPQPEIAINLLRKQDVAALCTADSAAFEQHQRAQPPFVLSVTPSFALPNWHFSMEEYYSSVLGLQTPEVKGVRTARCAAYWIHDFVSKTLVVLRTITPGSLVVESGDEEKDLVEDMRAIWAAAGNEARLWGFSKVVAWNPTRLLIDAAEKTPGIEWASVEEREMDSIPAIRWKHGEPAELTGPVVWCANEKYAWC